MTLFVKICGLTTRDAVDAAVEAGADAIGFVFHDLSPRNIAPKDARKLAEGVPASVLKAAVTRAPLQGLIDRVIGEFELDLWQSDAADFQTITLPHRVALLPVVRRREKILPPRMVFEGAASGAGARADWTVARDLALRAQVILAGGLTVASVADAIAHVKPHGVDVSSGVESVRGMKEPRMIFEFVRAARAAERDAA